MSNQTAQPTLALIVDDDEITARRLKSLLHASNIKARHFTSLVCFLDWLDYDQLEDGTVIATAVDLAELNGFDLLNILRADNVTIPTILMSRNITVAVAVEAMHAGANYILNKPFTEAEFKRAIARALTHATHQRPAERSSEHAVRQRFSSLSVRQRQLLAHVFDGLTNREIADRLSISPKTVELHRSAMMEKMGVGSLAELIRAVARCDDLLHRESGRGRA